MSELSFHEVKHLSPEYWDTVHLRYDVLRKPLNIDFFYSDLLAEDKDHHLAAYQDEELVACLIMTPKENGIIKMRQVAVASDKQKTGIGGKLVEFSERFSKEKGFKEIHLHARDVAVPFYLRLNYEIYDEPFTEVTIPHRKMKKVVG